MLRLCSVVFLAFLVLQAKKNKTKRTGLNQVKNDFEGIVFDMRKEDLVKMGLDEETAKKVAEASMEELKNFIPKVRFDEVNAEKKNLETAKNTLEGQLETLKNSTGDIESMRNQIATLQAENKTKDEAHAAEIKQLKIDAAVDKALSDAKAKNPKAVKALLDLEKAELADDGAVKGLDAMIKTLTEADDSKFLFDTDATQNKNPKLKGVIPGQNKDGIPGVSSEFETRLAEARKNGNTLEAIKVKQEAAAEGVVLI